MGMVDRNARGNESLNKSGAVKIMIRINQIKLPVTHTEQELVHKIEKALQLKRLEQTYGKMDYTYEIIRRSMDARKKPDLFYVYSVNVLLEQMQQNGSELEAQIVKKIHQQDVQIIQDQRYRLPESTRTPEQSPVIVGSGPAGLFCAYLLAETGCKPIILERGESVEERKQTVEQFWNGTAALNPESNVQFGEGGAGTFSDGKLNTLVKDPIGRNRFVLETFVKFGAKKEIIYENKPHLGTDELTHIIRNMRNHIIEKGGNFHFNTCVKELLVKDGRIYGVRTDQDEFKTDKVILAIGHSARDTFRMLQEEQITLQAKSFAVGLRIEHPQEQINECQYGIQKDVKLPAADYKLTNQASNGRSVYSFCMCPGGYVVNASSEEQRLAVNGMSYSARDGVNANSALIVSVTPADYGSDDALAGIEFQRKLEESAYRIGKGKVPVQRYGDYKEGVCREIGQTKLMPCIKGGYESANLRELFSEEINSAMVESIEKFGYTMLGYNRSDAILSGVESRTSSPVRIVRDETGQSNIRGLYPCGEGAGYAGGITSAAMDGIKTAEHILEEYKVG